MRLSHSFSIFCAFGLGLASVGTAVGGLPVIDDFEAYRKVRLSHSFSIFCAFGLGLASVGTAVGGLPVIDDFEAYRWGSGFAGSNGWSVVDGELVAGGSPVLDGTALVYALETSHAQVARYSGVARCAVPGETNVVLWLDVLVDGGLERLTVGSATDGEYFGLSRSFEGQLSLDATYRTKSFTWVRVAVPEIPLGLSLSTSAWTRLTFEMNFPVRPVQAVLDGIPAFRLYVNGQVQTNAQANVYADGTNPTVPTGEPRSWFGFKRLPLTGVTRLEFNSAGGGYLDDLLLSPVAPPLAAPEAAPVRLLSIDSEAQETGLKPAVLRLERVASGTNWLAVSYVTSGDAIFGLDYEALPQTLVIPAFADAAEVLVRPRNVMADQVRALVVTLTSNRYAYGAAPLAQTVTVVPDDSEANRRSRGPSSRHTGFTISELMYHPAARLDGRDGQYVEIMNTQPVSERLDGHRLDGDIAFTFPTPLRVPAGGLVVVAKDPGLFPPGAVYGPFEGRLGQAGGRVQLRNRSDALLLELDYADREPWPVAADGTGHALALVRPDYGEGDWRAWGAGSRKGGTPGWLESVAPHGYEGLCLNEWLAATQPPTEDFIELFNASGQVLDIGGCGVSDQADNVRYVVPSNTVLAAGGYLVLGAAQLGFGLSSSGERLFLTTPDGEAVIDAIRFGAQVLGVSEGRWPDGDDRIRSLMAPTAGTTNAAPRASDIVINEIMFHPISGHDDDSYVELHNHGTNAVNVGYWAFTEGITYVLPSGSVIPSGGFLVVAKNVTNLLARYPHLNGGNTVGNFSGRLSGRGERLVLSRPLDLARPFEDYVTVNAVTYSDGRGDWSDGGGSSLELLDPRSDNSRASQWADSDESQKAPWTAVDYTGSIDYGVGATSPFQIRGIHPGEYVVDDLVMTSSGGSVVHVQDNFESGTGWSSIGSHVRTRIEDGVGVDGTRGLMVRASDRGEFAGADGRFANQCSKNMAVAPTSGQICRIQAQVRWVRGFPYLLMGPRGYWMATTGELTLPPDLGSPGLTNSRWVANAGPAIDDVAHAPIRPATGQAVRVSCSVDDPDGVAVVILRYRLDPATNYTALVMVDDGTGGDLRGGDGIYTALLPGQVAGVLAAYTLEAHDALGAVSRSPSPWREVPLTPPSEFLVMWGLPPPVARGIPEYRLLMSAANAGLLAARGGFSKELVEMTYLYEDFRALQRTRGRYRAGYTISGYVLQLPKAERLLGGNQLSVIYGEMWRIRWPFWAVREVDEPAAFLRPIGLAVGNGARSLLNDYLTPSAELSANWFGDDDPEVFKNQDWTIDAFGRYQDAFGRMKTSRYAGLNTKRAVDHPNDDYSQVFKIATTVATANNAAYVERVKAVVDIRSWASYFATAGLLGDNDHYGYTYVHNYYVYIPRHGRSQLYLHDMDFSFNNPPSVRYPSSHAVPRRMFEQTPAFDRTYWAFLKDMADGPLRPEETGRFYDEWNAAYVRNGWGSQGDRKAALATARASVLTGLIFQMPALTIDNQGGAPFATAVNPLTLTGTVSVAAADLRINGQSHAVRHPDVLSWVADVWLAAGTNTLVVEAFDGQGRLVPNGLASIAVTYTGPEVLPDGKLVINEIMYNPDVPYAAYVELLNVSTQTLSLGGLRVEGVDGDIGPGRMLAPGGLAVLAESIPGYQAAWSNAEVVVAEYAGVLDKGGETLRLLRPDGVGGWVELDRVRYDDDPPWPGQADGGGASLQRIDPLQDGDRAGNWAVDPATPATPGTVNSVVQALPAFVDVWINELMPTNHPASGIVDAAGEAEPWVELYNSGAEAVDLGAGYYLTADSGTLLQWAFPPGTVIASGGYLVVWLDGETGEGAPGSPHANFRPPAAQGMVALVWEQGGIGYVVDALAYGGGTDGVQAFGKYPDGSPHSVVLLPQPTPGNANDLTVEAAILRINEWMALNGGTLRDPADLDADDWFELYNAGSNRVDLYGYYLTDKPGNTNSYHRVRDSYPMLPGSFRLVWADDETGQNGPGRDLHVAFRLSGDGESIALYAPDFSLVDRVDFGQQLTDVSEGRYPDGGPMRYAMPLSTPGMTNRLFELRSIEGLSAVGDWLSLSWSASSGRHYRLLFSERMTTGVWHTLIDDIPATLDLVTTNIAVQAPARFYRIEQR